MLPLNRLFLGNPGTGKTSIAKVYGRILKGLGYLSDGSVEVRTPSDLIASAVGGTEEKTAALLEICKGKVLVIDEAYALHEGMYGAPAPSTRSPSACKCSPRRLQPSPQVRRARH
jgi:DNA replication protein DnaC